MTRRRRERHRWVTLLVALLLAPWLAWAVVRLAGLDRTYPVAAAVAFTPYVAATSVLPLLVALALRRWAVAGLALATCLAFALLVVPRTLGSPASGSGDPVVVMEVNAFLGRADARAVVATARREHVDVLALTELTPQEVERLDAAGIGSLLPHRDLHPGRGASGTGLLSRRPLADRRDDALHGLAAMPTATTSAGGGALRVTAVHPYPPLGRARTGDWERTLAAIPGGDGAGTGAPIVLGDFNATLDHRALRGVLARGYRDAADEVGAGLRATWPVDGSRPGIAIDHVLVGPGVGVRSFDVRPVPGTDHRAVVARLELAPGRRGT